MGEILLLIVVAAVIGHWLPDPDPREVDYYVPYWPDAHRQEQPHD